MNLIPRDRVHARRLVRQDPPLLLDVRARALLMAFRGVVRVVPRRRIAEYLGTPMRETPFGGVDAHQLRYARRVGAAIDRVSTRLPPNLDGLPQALTARWLLHRKCIPSTIYYGAAFDDDDGRTLQSHVWLRCGAHIITGRGPAHRRFAPLSWFADDRGARRPATPPTSERVQA